MVTSATSSAVSIPRRVELDPEAEKAVNAVIPEGDRVDPAATDDNGSCEVVRLYEGDDRDIPDVSSRRHAFEKRAKAMVASTASAIGKTAKRLGLSAGKAIGHAVLAAGRFLFERRVTLTRSIALSFTNGRTIGLGFHVEKTKYEHHEGASGHTYGLTLGRLHIGVFRSDPKTADEPSE